RARRAAPARLGPRGRARGRVHGETGAGDFGGPGNRGSVSRRMSMANERHQRQAPSQLETATNTATANTAQDAKPAAASNGPMLSSSSTGLPRFFQFTSLRRSILRLEMKSSPADRHTSPETSLPM